MVTLEYRRRQNNELYLYLERITDSIRKRRISFYGHITPMNSERLTNRIFTYFVNKKAKGPWFTEAEKYLREIVMYRWENDPREAQSWKQTRNVLRKGKRSTEDEWEITGQEDGWINVVQNRPKRKIKNTLIKYAVIKYMVKCELSSSTERWIFSVHQNDLSIEL